MSQKIVSSGTGAVVHIGFDVEFAGERQKPPVLFESIRHEIHIVEVKGKGGETGCMLFSMEKKKEGWVRKGETLDVLKTLIEKQNCIVFADVVWTRIFKWQGWMCWEGDMSWRAIVSDNKADGGI